MVKPNTTFKLSVDDMDAIENSLRASITARGAGSEETKRINRVLGNLHNQKSFYRPKHGAYVGG